MLLSTQPSILKEIGYARLAKLLNGFEQDLKDSNLSLPDPEAVNGEYFSDLATLLARTDGLLTTLHNTLQLLEHAAAPENDAKIDEAIQRRIPRVCVSPTCPLDRVLELWFLVPDELSQFLPPTLTPTPTPTLTLRLPSPGGEGQGEGEPATPTLTPNPPAAPSASPSPLEERAGERRSLTCADAPNTDHDAAPSPIKNQNSKIENPPEGDGEPTIENQNAEAQRQHSLAPSEGERAGERGPMSSPIEIKIQNSKIPILLTTDH